MLIRNFNIAFFPFFFFVPRNYSHLKKAQSLWLPFVFLLYCSHRAAVSLIIEHPLKQSLNKQNKLLKSQEGSPVARGDASESR